MSLLRAKFKCANGNATKEEAAVSLCVGEKHIWVGTGWEVDIFNATFLIYYVG